MHRQKQHVLFIGNSCQLRSNKRVPSQVKRFAGALAGQMHNGGVAQRFRLVAQVCEWHLKRFWRFNKLDGFIVDDSEPAPQYLMPSYDFTEASFESATVKLSQNAQST